VCIQGREGGFKGVGGEERKERKSMMVIHLVENSDLLSDSPGPRSESICYFFSLLPVHPDPERSGRQSGREREREMETSEIPLPPHPLYSVHVYVFHDRVCALFTYRNYFSIRNPFGDIGRK
jgi:hypothetical protein